MLLPQSAAFASLKNRLNAVSAIGYLSMPVPASRITPAAPTSGNASVTAGPSAAATSSFERANRLKVTGGRDGEGHSHVRWVELLDRFKAVQERSRRAKNNTALGLWNEEQSNSQNYQQTLDDVGTGRRYLGPAEAGLARGKGVSAGAPNSRPTSAGDLATAAIGPGGTRIPALAGRYEGQGPVPAVVASKEKDGHRGRFSASQLGRKFVGGGKDKGKK